MEYILITILILILIEASYLVYRSHKDRVPQTRRGGRLILVDTSVLIDGRIISVAQSGFISDTLAVPRSVIGELQFLADNADHEKRSRARYGLDVVKELQNMGNVDLLILQDGSKAEEGVDERLLKLAKQRGAAICTIDYNLNKVAAVEGIQVLNINDLAQTLRMAYLPGERMLLELVQKGQDDHQAVGYLVDGTMVVVDQANKLIGQKVEIEFIRALQTSAGKMMFARLVDAKKYTSGTDAKAYKNNKPSGQKIITTEYKPKVKNNKTKAYSSSKRTSQQKREADLINLVEKQ